MNLLVEASGWMRGHLSPIALAICAGLLAVFGDTVSRVVRRSVKPFNFFVRAGVFILLVTFGFGALTLLAASLLARGLAQLDRHWLAPVVVLAFVAIAIIAEEKHKI